MKKYFIELGFCLLLGHYGYGQSVSFKTYMNPVIPTITPLHPTTAVNSRHRPWVIIRKLLWISCGDNDSLITFSQRTHDYLLANDVPHIYYIEPGVHDFKVWRNSLYMFSQLIFKPADVSNFPQYTVLGTPAPTNVRKTKYPQLLPDNRAVFRIKVPDAQRV